MDFSWGCYGESFAFFSHMCGFSPEILVSWTGISMLENKWLDANY